MTVKPTAPSPPKRKYIDRPEIAEVFADGLERLTFDGSSLRLEFVVIRQDEQGGDLWAYTAARLVLSPQGVSDMMDKLTRLQAALDANAREADVDAAQGQG